MDLWTEWKFSLNHTYRPYGFLGHEFAIHRLNRHVCGRNSWTSLRVYKIDWDGLLNPVSLSRWHLAVIIGSSYTWIIGREIAILRIPTGKLPCETEVSFIQPLTFRKATASVQTQTKSDWRLSKSLVLRAIDHTEFLDGFILNSWLE